jgi:hypothetical protein
VAPSYTQAYLVSASCVARLAVDIVFYYGAFAAPNGRRLAAERVGVLRGMGLEWVGSDEGLPLRASALDLATSGTLAKWGSPSHLVGACATQYACQVASCVSIAIAKSSEG